MLVGRGWLRLLEEPYLGAKLNKKIVAATAAVLAAAGVGAWSWPISTWRQPPKPPVHSTQPTPVPTTPPVTTPPKTTPPATGKSVVFSAPFTDRTNWVTGRTSSYPPGNPQTNRGDNKLDSLTTTPLVGSNFVAMNNTNGTWTTDLVTTEGTTHGFKVKTGDELSAVVTVQAQIGAWPAIWTWGDGSLPGHGEVDLFEYHGDNPRLLELTNHVGGGGHYADNVVTPGQPFTLDVKFLASGVVWSVNGKTVYTGGGLPSNWAAYLIVNLSISAGQYHPAPNDTAPRYFSVTDLKVYR